MTVERFLTLSSGRTWTNVKRRLRSNGWEYRTLQEGPGTVRVVEATTGKDERLTLTFADRAKGLAITEIKYPDQQTQDVNNGKD